MRRERRPVGARKRAASGTIFSKRSTARRVTRKAGGTRWRRISARSAITFISVNARVRPASRRKAAFLWLDSIRVSEMWGAQIFRGRAGNPAPEPMSRTEKEPAVPLPGTEREGRGTDGVSAFALKGACSASLPANPRLTPWAARFRRFAADMSLEPVISGSLQSSGWLSRSCEASSGRAGKIWRARKSDSPKWRVTMDSGSRTAVRLIRAFQRSNRSIYVDI